MSHVKPMEIRWTTVPGNSQVVIPFDTTRGPSVVTTSQAVGGSFQIPGPWRGMYAGTILRVTIQCTTQPVDWFLDELTGNAGTTADWLVGSGTHTGTIVAGTPQTFELKPNAADWRFLVAGGATGPSAMVVTITIIPSSNFGTTP